MVLRAPRSPRGLLFGALLWSLALGAAGCHTVPAIRYPGLPDQKDGALHFIVFNVGQADCMLVAHRGRTMLVDAGASSRKHERASFRDVARRLEALTGSRHLDYVVISHYHQDHVGLHGTGKRASLGDLGLWGLLGDEGVTVGALVDRGTLTFGEKGATQVAYERAVPHWIEERKVGERRTVKLGERIDLGPGVDVEVVAVNSNGRLGDLRAADRRQFERYPPSENDYSLSLKFTLGPFELFSGGDLSGLSQQKSFGPVRVSYNDIESIAVPRIGDVEVYRVNHHGSDHSSNPCFVQALHPEVSIFSTGANSYGHPSIRVYDLLKSIGRVFITGGADPRVLEHVKGDLVRGDVEVLVEPGGERYWVNGTLFRSKTDAEEKVRADYVTECRPYAVGETIARPGESHED